MCECDTRNQLAETAVLMAAEQTGAEVSVVFNLGHLLLRVLALFSIITNYDHNDSDSESRESTSASSCYSSINTHIDSESNAYCPAFILRIFAIFFCCSGDNKSVTVPRVAGNLTADIEEFIVGLRRYFKNILGEELQENDANEFRRLFSHWNTFLQQVQGEQLAEDDKKWSKRWLPRWNMFLQARAGETLVTRWNVCLTIVGFIFYIVDLVSDIGTTVYYAANGQWWQAVGTLTIVYGAVIIHAVIKWINSRLHFTGAAAWLRYVPSLLVNWPDLKLYGALCRVEWQLCKSPACSAHLVPEWHQRRLIVTRLKFTEGVCEACPQAILQLCLLVPDLYGARTFTDYLRIAGACVSLCTAGAALVNYEKQWRIKNNIDLSLSELVVLHMWAVPVTVSRLLSLALLLSVHPYWGLGGVALPLVLSGVYVCRTDGIPRTLDDVIAFCLVTLQFCMSPFLVIDTVTTRRVYHAVHLLLNTAMMMVWALGTPLVCAHPALYTAIICFNTAMMVVGLMGMELHGKYWPDSYFIE